VFKERLDPSVNLDSVEGKLFGLGLESYTAGSHEFYFGYAMSRRILYARHRPLSSDRNDRRRISAVLMFVPGSCYVRHGVAGTATTSSSSATTWTRSPGTDAQRFCIGRTSGWTT
jgi:hypothetical protein